MTAPGAGLPSKAPTTGQPSGPRPAGPPEWLSSSRPTSLQSCIVYDATGSEPSCDIYGSHGMPGGSSQRGSRI